MDTTSIALAVALGVAVFAFGVLVGSLTTAARYRKKAALASMESALHAAPAMNQAAAVPESPATAPAAGPPPTAAPASEASTGFPPAEPGTLLTAEPAAAVPDLMAPAAIPSFELPATAPALESPAVPAFESSETLPSIGPVNELPGYSLGSSAHVDEPEMSAEPLGGEMASDSLESLLAEVTDTSGGTMTQPESASLPSLEEEPASLGAGLDLGLGSLPEIGALDLPEVASEPDMAQPASRSEISWELPSESMGVSAESEASAEPESEIVWEIPGTPEALEPLGESEFGAGDVETELGATPLESQPLADAGLGWGTGLGLEGEPEASSELSWELPAEALPTLEPVPAAMPESEGGAEAAATVEPPESQPAWALDSEAFAAPPQIEVPSVFEPAEPLAVEPEAEPQPEAEAVAPEKFAWELPVESAPFGEAGETPLAPESELTWVTEPGAVLPPIFEAPAEIPEPVAEVPAETPPAELEPSWLAEPPATAALEGAGDWPVVVEPASVQGTVPEPAFSWSPAEAIAESGAAFGEVSAPAADVPQPVHSERPRAHVSTLPEAPSGEAPVASAKREPRVMPPASLEGVDMVAPVQMWFGDYAVAVKAGSKTHTQFRKYADVLLADLRDATDRDR